MLIAYILTKSRFLKIKIIKNKEIGVFKKDKFEYIIDRSKIYQKKFLGFKTFFFSMYLEGNPNPLEFTETGYNLQGSDVPLDEIALLIRKVMHGAIELIMLLLIAFNLILTGGILYILTGG